MPYTLDRLAGVFEQVSDKLDIANAVLAVSCLGAYAGVAFALRYPHRVDKLVLIQVAEIGQAIAWSRKADVAGLIATPFIGQALAQMLQIQVVRHWYRSALNLDPSHPRCRQYTGLALDAVRHGSCFCLASAYQMLQANPTIEWQRLSQPALLVYGVRDPTHVDTEWDALPSQLPGCRSIAFENSAHFPNLEEPDRFSALIEDWG